MGKEGDWLARHTTADGREIEYFDAGAVDGLPLVCHHGTPYCAVGFAPWIEPAEAFGIRIIAYSRPGYGVSTRLKGRNVAHAVQDTASLLDHLGVDTFVTTGWSGGGPHALACGALLAERCIGVATLAGVGAWGYDDLDFMDGMADENVGEFSAALNGEEAISAYIVANYPGFDQVKADELAAALGGLVSPPDQAALTDAFADSAAAAVRWSLRTGIDGWIDDYLAFTRPWGFELADIRVPVTVWQGQQDNMVPAQHGRWLAEHIPGARFQYDANQGHLSLITTHLGAILQGLREMVK